MSTNDRAALLLVTPELLSYVLQLPAGSYIDSAQVRNDRPGTLELRIRGAGWQVVPGNLLTATTATITMLHTTRPPVVIDWGLPRGEA